MGLFRFGFKQIGHHERAQDVPYQDQVGQEAQAEPSHPPVDQDEDWQHYPVQRQEASLEEDQAEVVKRLRPPTLTRHVLGRHVPMYRILTDFPFVLDPIKSVQEILMLCRKLKMTKPKMT